MLNFLLKKKSNQPIYLFNTLSREKEIFVPIKSGKVGLYTCGPTVYGFPHLGNMRTYVFEDILKRVLNYNTYKVRHIMNITDVGHLTGDRDMGDDKIEIESKKEGKTAWEIADFYTKVFKEDLNNLNIIFPDVFCKATDNIKEQIEMIEVLEKKGFTYKTSDGVYFDTSKVVDYNKLSHQKLEDLKEGARIEANPEKKNPTDFALWKFSSRPSSGQAQRQMEWPSPYGVGFPGWHIECSAMSVKYLGEQFDIHCGAVDFVNLHHTNELAQTESATGKKPWVKYWLHGEFLNLDKGRKMSKSAGDSVTVNNTFIEKGMSPLVFRFVCLNTHYRKAMEWNDEIAVSSSHAYEILKKKITNLGKEIGRVDSEWKVKFNVAINDDLNMAQALAVLNEMLKSELPPAHKLATALDFDKVFGLELKKVSEKDEVKIDIPEEIQKLVDERKTARANKDWKKSDELREKVKSLGYEVKDTPEGQEIVKI
jgi:cysteinyl-tRNA synthetase